MQLLKINNANILNEYILILICLKLTILTCLQDEISSDRMDRDRCLYAYSIQNINNCQLVLEEAHCVT